MGKKYLVKDLTSCRKDCRKFVKYIYLDIHF